MGDPVLAQTAVPIISDNVDNLPLLIHDMIDTMKAANGVGLAAPQIGLSLRIIVFEIPSDRLSEQEAKMTDGPQVLINPMIKTFNEEKELDWEGCLSIPGLRGEVPRHSSIEYTGLDGEGTKIEKMATGFHARVIQHEIDHLDGILYPERMTDMRRFGFVEELESNG